MSNIIPFHTAEASKPIEVNKSVQELAALLNKHGMHEDAKGLNEIFNHIVAMENDLGKAISELTAVRQELADIRDVQKHPISNMLHNTAESLMAMLKALYRQILALKDKLVGGCKEAVEEIKDKGISAANGIVDKLGIKDNLEMSRIRIGESIASAEKKRGIGVGGGLGLRFSSGELECLVGAF